MARKMDAYQEQVDRSNEITKLVSKLQKEIYQLKKEQEKLDAMIISEMKTSTLGTLDGVPVFEIVEVPPRETITKARVLEVCPKFYDELINDPNKKSKKKVKFL